MIGERIRYSYRFNTIGNCFLKKIYSKYIQILRYIIGGYFGITTNKYGKAKCALPVLFVMRANTILQKEVLKYMGDVIITRSKGGNGAGGSSTKGKLVVLTYEGNVQWTVPNAVDNRFDVRIFGGGGGGASVKGNNNTTVTNAGAGGGGGWMNNEILTLEYGMAIQITIGAGGIRQTVNKIGTGIGGAGGLSSFGTYLSANGGSGGTADWFNGGLGGSGGSGGGGFGIFNIYYRRGIGGIGYQFGGGGYGSNSYNYFGGGGNGGIWGGGGGGASKGGTGGTYGGGGGGNGIGGAYGGNSGNNGINTIGWINTEINIYNNNYITGPGLCMNPGNKIWGGGGFGGCGGDNEYSGGGGYGGNGGNNFGGGGGLWAGGDGEVWGGGGGGWIIGGNGGTYGGGGGGYSYQTDFNNGDYSLGGEYGGNSGENGTNTIGWTNTEISIYNGQHITGHGSCLEIANHAYGGGGFGGNGGYCFCKLNSSHQTVNNGVYGGSGGGGYCGSGGNAITSNINSNFAGGAGGGGYCSNGGNAFGNYSAGGGGGYYGNGGDAYNDTDYAVSAGGGGAWGDGGTWNTPGKWGSGGGTVVFLNNSKAYSTNGGNGICIIRYYTQD